MLETAFHDEVYRRVSIYLSVFLNIFLKPNDINLCAPVVQFSLMNPDATKRNFKTLDKAVDLVNTAVLHRRVKNKERDHALTVIFTLFILQLFYNTLTAVILIASWRERNRPC